MRKKGEILVHSEILRFEQSGRSIVPPKLLCSLRTMLWCALARAALRYDCWDWNSKTNAKYGHDDV